MNADPNHALHQAPKQFPGLVNAVLCQRGVYMPRYMAAFAEISAQVLEGVPAPYVPLSTPQLASSPVARSIAQTTRRRQAKRQATR